MDWMVDCRDRGGQEEGSRRRKESERLPRRLGQRVRGSGKSGNLEESSKTLLVGRFNHYSSIHFHSIFNWKSLGTDTGRKKKNLMKAEIPHSHSSPTFHRALNANTANRRAPSISKNEG